MLLIILHHQRLCNKISDNKGRCITEKHLPEVSLQTGYVLRIPTGLHDDGHGVKKLRGQRKASRSIGQQSGKVQLRFASRSRRLPRVEYSRQRENSFKKLKLMRNLRTDAVYIQYFDQL